MSIANKLAKSVRQAKENNSSDTGKDIFDLESSPADSRPSPKKTATPRAGRRPEPESPLPPFPPSRRVWPD